MCHQDNMYHQDDLRLRLQDNKVLPIGVSFESAKEILVELQKIGVNFSMDYGEDEYTLINVRNLDSVSDLLRLRGESMNYRGLFIGRGFSPNIYYVLEKYNLEPSETLRNLLIKAEKNIISIMEAENSGPAGDYSSFFE